MTLGAGHAGGGAPGIRRVGRGLGSRGPDVRRGVHKGASILKSGQEGGNVSLTPQHPAQSLWKSPRWAGGTPGRGWDRKLLFLKYVTNHFINTCL